MGLINDIIIVVVVVVNRVDASWSSLSYSSFSSPKKLPLRLLPSLSISISISLLSLSSSTRLNTPFPPPPLHPQQSQQFLRTCCCCIRASLSSKETRSSVFEGGEVLGDGCVLGTLFFMHLGMDSFAGNGYHEVSCLGIRQEREDEILLLFLIGVSRFSLDVWIRSKI